MSVDTHTVVDLQEILIVGNRRTKTSFFASELKQDVLKSRNGKTVESYLRSLNDLTGRLVGANMFESVDSNLQVQEVGEGRCKATIIITVKEKGVPFVNAQSYVRAGDSMTDAGFEIQAALRSPLGHGEHLRLSSVTSAAGTREYGAHMSIPHAGGDWLLSAKSGQDQALPWLSYQVGLKSFLLQYKPSADSKHQLTAEYSLRDETPNAQQPAPNALLDAVSSLLPATSLPASAAVLASATSSIKSSLKHVWTAVDKQRLSCCGVNKFLQTSLELAAPLAGEGAAEFLKADLTARYERQLGPKLFSQPGLTLSLGGNLGVMYPLGLLVPAFSRKADGLKPFTSNLCDRYHLGGPLSLRGFGPSGVGPRALDKKDSLGGDSKAALLALLSVPVPVPTLADASMRAFAFINVGGLGSSDQWVQEGREGAGRLLPSFGSLRASAGAGFSLNMANTVRVETTYSFPFLKAQHDTTTPFQLGIGLSIN